jgi:hypothetical protein
MKKASKPTAEKSPKKLKRKAQLAALVEQFTAIADRLERAVDRLAHVGMGQRHSNQNNDELELGGRDE